MNSKNGYVSLAGGMLALLAGGAQARAGEPAVIGALRANQARLAARVAEMASRWGV